MGLASSSGNRSLPLETPDSSEIENLRRSVAMLPPQAASLSREEAMKLFAELQKADQRIRELREGLTLLLERSSPDTGGEQSD